MGDRLSIPDRMRLIEELERVSFLLADIAAWLFRNDAEAAADLLMEAAKSVAAAGWIVETPVRPRVPGALAQGMQRPAASGQPDPG